MILAGDKERPQFIVQLYHIAVVLVRSSCTVGVNLSITPVAQQCKASCIEDSKVFGLKIPPLSALGHFTKQIEINAFTNTKAILNKYCS